MQIELNAEQLRLLRITIFNSFINEMYEFKRRLDKDYKLCYMQEYVNMLLLLYPHNERKLVETLLQTNLVDSGLTLKGRRIIYTSNKDEMYSMQNR